MTTMGETIKSKRLEHGWTQQDIADMTGVSKTHIYCIEKGKRGMSVELLLKMSDLFRCSPADLIGMKGQGGKTA